MVLVSERMNREDKEHRSVFGGVVQRLGILTRSNSPGACCATSRFRTAHHERIRPTRSISHPSLIAYIHYKFTLI